MDRWARRIERGTTEPTSSRHAPLLELTDLRTGFHSARGTAWAVDGVSLTLEQGQTLGIVGESGSGKTVLARSIMRLLPRSNVECLGEIHFAGTDVNRLSDSDLRALRGSEMAMVFQDPMTSLNPVVRVGRQVTESLRFHRGLRGRQARETAIDLLRSVRIPEPDRRMREFPHQLSGGMRQRVSTAIALSCAPRLLIADEPTTALDVTVQSQILDLLQAQQERSMAMIMVTHDLGIVASRADQIAVMYAGQIVEKAPTRVLFSDTKMPYTQALLNSIPRLTNPRHTRLVAISGRPPDLVSPPSGCRFAPRCEFAQDRCRREMPPLVEAEAPGHSYRCWFPVGSASTGNDVEVNHRHDSTPLSSVNSPLEAR